MNQHNEMTTPTWLYHRTIAPQGKLFDAHKEDIQQLLSEGWFDNPAFEESKPTAVVHAVVSDESLVAREKELDAYAEKLAALDKQLNARTQALDEAMEVLAAERKAFQEVIQANLGGVDTVVKTLSQRFSDDPKELTVQELYSYGKAIGAGVHHKHNEDTLINVISEYLANGNAG